MKRRRDEVTDLLRLGADKRLAALKTQLAQPVTVEELKTLLANSFRWNHPERMQLALKSLELSRMAQREAQSLAIGAVDAFLPQIADSPLLLEFCSQVLVLASQSYTLALEHALALCVSHPLFSMIDSISCLGTLQNLLRSNSGCFGSVFALGVLNQRHCMFKSLFADLDAAESIWTRFVCYQRLESSACSSLDQIYIQLLLFSRSLFLEAFDRSVGQREFALQLTLEKWSSIKVWQLHPNALGDLRIVCQSILRDSSSTQLRAVCTFMLSETRFLESTDSTDFSNTDMSTIQFLPIKRIVSDTSRLLSLLSSTRIVGINFSLTSSTIQLIAREVDKLSCGVLIWANALFCFTNSITSAETWDFLISLTRKLPSIYQSITTSLRASFSNSTLCWPDLLPQLEFCSAVDNDSKLSQLFSDAYILKFCTHGEVDSSHDSQNLFYLLSRYLSCISSSISLIRQMPGTNICVLNGLHKLFLRLLSFENGSSIAADIYAAVLASPEVAYGCNQSCVVLRALFCTDRVALNEIVIDHEHRRAFFDLLLMIPYDLVDPIGMNINHYVSKAVQLCSSIFPCTELINDAKEMTKGADCLAGVVLKNCRDSYVTQWSHRVRDEISVRASQKSEWVRAISISHQFEPGEMQRLQFGHPRVEDFELSDPAVSRLYAFLEGIIKYNEPFIVCWIDFSEQLLYAHSDASWTEIWNLCAHWAQVNEQRAPSCRKFLSCFCKMTCLLSQARGLNLQLLQGLLHAAHVIPRDSLPQLLMAFQHDLISPSVCVRNKEAILGLLTHFCRDHPIIVSSLLDSCLIALLGSHPILLDCCLPVLESLTHNPITRRKVDWILDRLVSESHLDSTCLAALMAL